MKDETCHFVDDERSTLLFAGYTTAASELAVQLRGAGLYPDENHPLFVLSALRCRRWSGWGGVWIKAFIW